MGNRPAELCVSMLMGLESSPTRCAMVCQACNAAIGLDVRFCPKCGAPVVQQPYPAPPFSAAGYGPAHTSPFLPRLRVTRNLQILGVLWCVFGAYRVIGGLIGMFFLQAWATHGFGNGTWPFGGHMGPQFPQAWMGFLLPVIATLTIVSAALAFLTGFSLLSSRPWGRTLAIVAAILALFKFPLGTALGIYTLWVLAPGASGVEYDSITARS